MGVPTGAAMSSPLCRVPQRAPKPDVTSPATSRSAPVAASDSAASCSARSAGSSATGGRLSSGASVSATMSARGAAFAAAAARAAASRRAASEAALLCISAALTRSETSATRGSGAVAGREEGDEERFASATSVRAGAAAGAPVVPPPRRSCTPSVRMVGPVRRDRQRVGERGVAGSGERAACDERREHARCQLEDGVRHHHLLPLPPERAAAGAGGVCAGPRGSGAVPLPFLSDPGPGRTSRGGSGGPRRGVAVRVQSVIGP